MTDDTLATRISTNTTKPVPSIGDKVIDKWGHTFGTIVNVYLESDEIVIAVFKGPYVTISQSQIISYSNGVWSMLWDIDIDDAVEIETEEVQVNPVPAPTQPSIQDTLNERGSRYGAFNSHAEITQAFKSVMAGGETNWASLTASQKEALEMIAHKIGRILNGDPNYADSWVDIAGYAQLVVNELESKSKK